MIPDPARRSIPDKRRKMALRARRRTLLQFFSMVMIIAIFIWMWTSVLDIAENYDLPISEPIGPECRLEIEGPETGLGGFMRNTLIEVNNAQTKNTHRPTCFVEGMAKTLAGAHMHKFRHSLVCAMSFLLRLNLFSNNVILEEQPIMIQTKT